MAGRRAEICRCSESGSGRPFPAPERRTARLIEPVLFGLAASRNDSIGSLIGSSPRDAVARGSAAAGVGGGVALREKGRACDDVRDYIEALARSRVSERE